ncbi:MAG: 7-carboxy-7-deazaguanine synthase QueE [Gammaproteobacteria bacterium]
MTDKNTLRITEIFLSLQGESSRVGIPTVFVRLTGCPLRCQYCDTAYAFNGGTVKPIEEIIDQVKSYQTPFVTVTGGEPLAQKTCLILMEKLCDQGFSVSLETSGAIDISKVDQRVNKVMDLKTPASLEEEKNDYQNLEFINDQDEIKFVICDRNDYKWSKNILEKYKLADRCQILFSPVADALSPSNLADWIIEDRLPVRFQIQLHKLLWKDEPGH